MVGKHARPEVNAKSRVKKKVVDQKQFYIYMLKCSDQSLYTGYTVHIENRMAMHRQGKGSAYVRSRLPFELVYQERCATRRAAMQREAEIKQWTREEKLKLLQTKTKRSKRIRRRKV